MRLNVFAGIEGTHQLVDSYIGGPNVAVPASSTNTPNQMLVFGPNIRETVELQDYDSIISAFFPDAAGKEEANIGVFKNGGPASPYVSLLQKAPVGTRFWFFKATDVNVAAELVKSMSDSLVSSNLNGRIQRLFGKPIETVEEAKDFIETQVSSVLETIATEVGASDWAPFDTGVYQGGANPEASPVLYRLYTKA